MAAEDSVELSVSEANFSKLTAKAYLVPVRISTVDGDGTGSLQRGIGYVVINTQTKLIKAITSTSEISGTLLQDYSGWTAKYDSGTEIDASQLFNGSLEDGPQLRTDGQNGYSTTVIVDMQKEVSIYGLRLARYYKDWYGWWAEEYYFSDVELEYSNDGQTWNGIGSTTENEMIKENGYQHIAFYGAVPMRYLKLKLTSGGSSVSSLAELGIYAK